jgi:hypothetical protein
VKRLFLGVAAVIAAVLLAGCQGSDGGPSVASASSSAASSAAAQPPAPQPSASQPTGTTSEAPASAQAPSAKASGLHCPTLAEAVSATGFTEMTHSSTDLSPDGSQVVCTYAPPASHGTDSRQLEIDVLYTSAPLSQAEQADAKEGLTVASAPQYGVGGYMADGNLPQYGLMCRVAGRASTGAIVAITVTAPDDTAFTPDAACAAAQQTAAAFLD